jgi:hypothetical protein
MTRDPRHGFLLAHLCTLGGRSEHPHRILANLLESICENLMIYCENADSMLMHYENRADIAESRGVVQAQGGAKPQSAKGKSNR